MFRRAAAALTLSAAGLLAVAPLAHAGDVGDPAPGAPTADSVDGIDGVDANDTDVSVLNNLTVPVQTCGVGLPILADVLGPDDDPASATATPEATCTVQSAPTAPPAAAQP